MEPPRVARPPRSSGADEWRYRGCRPHTRAGTLFGRSCPSSPTGRWSPRRPEGLPLLPSLHRLDSPRRYRDHHRTHRRVASRCGGCHPTPRGNSFDAPDEPAHRSSLIEGGRICSCLTGRGGLIGWGAPRAMRHHSFSSRGVRLKQTLIAAFRVYELPGDEDMGTADNGLKVGALGGLRGGRALL